MMENFEENAIHPVPEGFSPQFYELYDEYTKFAEGWKPEQIARIEKNMQISIKTPRDQEAYDKVVKGKNPTKRAA